MVSGPLALLPIEISTLVFGLYRMIAGTQKYEKMIGLISTLLHMKRFYDHKNTIINISLKEWKYSLVITLGLLFVLYNIISMKKSIILFAIIASFLQISGYLLASKHIKFKWVYPYDIPILFSSLFIGYSLFKKNNYWSIIWFSDVIYHIWELM